MKKRFISAQLSLLVAVAGLWTSTVAHAGITDIAQSPLASATTATVKPNLMFILDDSGSMDWDFLPDGANFGNDRYGNRSSHCNGIYYNPKVTYVPPVDHKGVSYPNATLAAAWKDGFNTGLGTVNITSSARYYLYSGTQSDAAYTYNSSGDVDTGTTYFKECNSVVDSDRHPGKSVFTLKTIDTSSAAAEQTNYANWYSYYRTRMLTMKTAAGRAFKNIDGKYRVGYSTIGYTGTDSTNRDFLKIADFSAAHKELFYSKLYSAAPTHWTPLRPALSKAGRIYAGKLLTGVDDPVQYSCQQNFTILSTDGYWNTNEETSSYGPDQIDGTTDVGNQDSALVSPMYDGSVSATRYRSTLTVTNAKDAYVKSITVAGVTITSGATKDDDDEATVARRIAAAVTANGYTATSSGAVVTITAPTSLGAINHKPDVKGEGTLAYTVTAFAPVTVASGGASNTLADVAAYYYNTDLRTSPNCTGALGTGIDVCNNNVTGSSSDDQLQQHMTTFTLGLGTNGRLQYAENYLQGGSADFEKIKQGTLNWPDPIANSGPERIDDLWHTAVNGHGTYFSAQNPDSLVSGLGKALGGVSARTGTAAAAATSNLEPVQGDNLLFLALYRTVKWDGDLQVKTIDPKTGEISPTVKWSAQEKLDAQVSLATDTRNIYFFNSVAPGKLKSFTWANLGATEQAYFNGVCAAPAKLSQCTDTTAGPNLTAAQRDLISGANLVNFIRGQTGHEDQAGNTDRIYRDREHVLGDMINSQPVYVKVPPFSYADAGYSAFKTAQKDRMPMVYVAANDGMVHAFEATIDQTTSGTEKWAYIPPMVMPNLHKLADMNYASNHQYTVDGAPTAGDVCPTMPSAPCGASDWKTILVGGLNAGGKGYYALDVTDPLNPKALWNYSVADDADMGLSFGNPVITKRKDGTWVVIFASGYNNTTGDGKGHLYVLNAYTGARILKLSTTAGDAVTPSGLAKINAWVDSTTDNTAKRFYGGDLLGNLWRFDTDDRIAPAGNEATLLAELGNVSPVGIQPITTRPLVSEISVGGVARAVVSVATGRYLGASDVSDTKLNSVYTVRDDLTATGLGKVRTADVLVKQTVTTFGSGGSRTTTTHPVDWSTKAGWYLDLGSPGERVNVDMRHQLETLTIAANVPDTDACTVGGYTWLYWLDYRSGQFVKGARNGLAAKRLSNNALTAGIQVLRLESGSTVTVVTGTDGDLTAEDNPSGGGGAGSGARRVSWRELID